MTEENEKAKLRRRVLALRSALTEEQRNRANVALTDAVVSDRLFLESKNILLFAGYGSEVDTTAMIQRAISCGKQVFLPKVIPQTLEPTMVFYRITGLWQLVPGFRNIPEPVGDTEQFSCSQDQIAESFLLVPGVAFDARGNRIGYGKGYYDRFFAENPALIPRSLAIGFSCQMVDRVPAEEQDIRLNRILCL